MSKLSSIAPLQPAEALRGPASAPRHVIHAGLYPHPDSTLYTTLCGVFGGRVGMAAVAVMTARHNIYLNGHTSTVVTVLGCDPDDTPHVASVDVPWGQWETRPWRDNPQEHRIAQAEEVVARSIPLSVNRPGPGGVKTALFVPAEEQAAYEAQLRRSLGFYGIEQFSSIGTPSTVLTLGACSLAARTG